MSGWSMTTQFTQSKLFIVILQSILELIPVSSSSFLHLFVENPSSLHLYSGISMLTVMINDLMDILLDEKRLIFYITTTFITCLSIVIFNNNMPVFSLYKINILSGFILLCSMVEISKDTFNFNIADGLIIGFLQSFAAIFPGFSRMGIVLSWLFFNGINISQSIKISYILGIPLNLLACLYEGSLHIKPELIFLSLLFTTLSYHIFPKNNQYFLHIIVILRILFFFLLHII